jgi:hypothetical protein
MLPLHGFASAVGVVGSGPDAVEPFLAFAQFAKADPAKTKADYVRALTALVPTLRHLEPGKNLDGKM